jgi:hypothetical protein
MEELSFESRMARMKLNTTLKLLKSSAIRTAEKIQVNKKKIVTKQSKMPWICVLLFFSIIFIFGIASLLGLHIHILNLFK